MRWGLGGAAAAAALCVACVAYDPNGPAVPHLAGRYAALVTVQYHSQYFLENRWDTLPATVTMNDAGARGAFVGRYVTVAGDTGTIGGTLLPDGTMEVTAFAQPPILTLQGATFLHRLYPWCDFGQVGTGTLAGRVSGDSLVIEGRASLLCRYELWNQALLFGTDLDVRLAGAR